MSVEFITKSSEPTPSEAGPTSRVLPSHSATADPEGAFPDMDADADVERVAVMETLCLACGREGVTRLLLTRIPYFRDIVVMSFECPHCFARNAEVQPANELAPKGCRVTLRIDPSDPKATHDDLNRQVIKSETCAILVPEADFEIPANTKRGDINTVEGVLSNVADSLEAGQPNRELSDPETAAKIEAVIARFRAFAAGKEAFTLILDDPAGNSFLENPAAPATDPRVQTKYYERSREQTMELGYAVEENKAEMEEQERKVIRGEEAAKKIKELFPQGMKGGAKTGAVGEARGVTVAPQLMDSLDTYFNVTDRLAVLQGQCVGCSHECETRMCVTDVPHFKEVVLLVTQCDACGYKDAEVKPTGSVSKMGRRITLKVTSPDDLKRDLLKSDTASIEIPELELELQSGTLGGKYTTLEGILDDIRESLATANPFSRGDSSEAEKRERMEAFVQRLEGLAHVHEPWTFILDCPLGNCFVHSEHGEHDPCLHVHRYERTFEQNEDLGLNDINVDDYMTEEQKAELERELQREKEEQEAAARSGAAQAAPQPVDPKEAERERLAQLMKSKIGGLIPVTHQEDDEGATGTAHGAVVPPKPVAASSSSSAAATEESKQ